MLTQLDSADVAWTGAGGVTVGAELKRVPDAVNCMFSGRLADHQLPLMRQQYDECYLIVEGLWRGEPGSGVLQQYRGELGRWGKWVDATSGQKRLMYTTFESWLSSMEILGGVRVRWSPSPETTADLLRCLHNWWQRDRHHTFQTLHKPAGDQASLVRPSMLRRIAAELPQIGWERSAAVATHFGTLDRMANASEADWMAIEGIGKGIAAKVVRAIHGE